MQKWIAVLPVLMCILMVQGQNKTIPLPADPSTAIVVVDYQGGNGPAVGPFLVIRADGRVTVTSQSHYPVTEPRVEGRLTASEVQELLRFIIDDQHFFQFDRNAVLRALPPPNTTYWVCCPATTTILVRTRDQERLNLFRGALRCASEYPSVKPLTEFAAIERRLTKTADIIAAGGSEAVQRALESANQYLRNRPELPSLTIDDFSSGNSGSDGRKTFSFGRDLPTAKHLSLRVTYVSATATEVIADIRDTNGPELLRYLQLLARDQTRDQCASER